MENFISRNKTTKAFNDYAHEIFQRQIELRIDDKAFDFDQGVVSELNLRRAIAGHLGGWLFYYTLVFGMRLKLNILTTAKTEQKLQMS